VELVDWSARPEMRNVPTEVGAEASIIADGCAARLLTVCNLLLADGCLPSEIETRVYRGLTGDSRAARVFRAGIGLDAALDRNAASPVAEAVGRGLRGQPDLDFCHEYEAAFARARRVRKACPWRCCWENA
jgi:hypothetical protein